jgi:hypothetical protein
VPFAVTYDASVLYPSALRDLLIRLAQTGLVQARWTDEILDEMFAALKRNRPDIDQISLSRSTVYAAAQQIADSWNNPPGSIGDVFDRLERNGLPISVAELRTGH